MKYTFGEKEKEYKDGKYLPVWKSPKYEHSKEKAIEVLDSNKYGLTEADFWILMNTCDNGKKMMYSGLIISHNGCLKINDRLEEQNKFNPECVTVNENGYGNSLVFTYKNKNQGIYEVGEVSINNCKNQYPYAMAFKRCFDRVVLKISKLAYEGIYSDSEAEEFKERYDDISIKKEETKQPSQETQPITKDEMYDMITKAVKEGVMKVEEVTESLRKFKKTKFVDLTYTQAKTIYDVAKKRLEARG